MSVEGSGVICVEALFEVNACTRTCIGNLYLISQGTTSFNDDRASRLVEQMDRWNIEVFCVGRWQAFWVSSKYC